MLRPNRTLLLYFASLLAAAPLLVHAQEAAGSADEALSGVSFFSCAGVTARSPQPPAASSDGRSDGNSD